MGLLETNEFLTQVMIGAISTQGHPILLGLTLQYLGYILIGYDQPAVMVQLVLVYCGVPPLQEITNFSVPWFPFDTLNDITQEGGGNSALVHFL